MENVACNYCGSAQVVPVITGRDRVFHPENVFHVVQCKHCALAYLNPRPDSAEIGGHYPEEYRVGLRDYPHSQRPMMKVGIGIWMKRRTPPLPPGGRLLDIGCSGGGYLLEMRKLGWDVHGVEMSEETAQHARKEFGLDVRSGIAEEAMAQFPDNYFDVVTSWHVLEHVFDPSRVMAEALRVLKPGGRLMLEVPNFQSVGRVLFRTYWFPLELPRHLYHFTPDTLEALLKKTGYQKVVIKGVPSALSITLSLQLLWNRLTGNLKSRWLILNPLLLALFIPVSWAFGKLGWSSHMTADAFKADPRKPNGAAA
jgi:2-polyprenyl-3-methyl-5-hydroxy-6-metoxy-1,4-benzoquinol methylase